MTVNRPLGQVLRDEEGVRLEFVRTYDSLMEDVWSTDGTPTTRCCGDAFAPSR